MDDLSAESFAERERDARDFLERFSALADADLTAEERIDRDLAAGHASRAAHRRRVAGLEARPADLLRTRRSTACSCCSCIGCGRSRTSWTRPCHGSPRSPPCSPRDAPTSTRRWPTRSSWNARSRPPGPAPGTSGTCCPPRCARWSSPSGSGARARWRPRHSTTGPCSWRGFAANGAWHLGLRRGALQPDAPGTRGAAVRCARPAGARPAGARPPRRRDVRARGAHRGHARLARGHRALGPGPPADGRGDAPGVRGLDGPGARLPRGPRPGHPARRRGVPGRAVARCSSDRCWASPRTWRRPRSATRSRATSSCPSRPTGHPTEEVDKRLSSNSHGAIPTVSVHEAYPGHHWHLVMRRIHATKLRRVLSTPYFTEGWALYSERLMREQGFFSEPIQELQHLEANIFRAARIVVDTSLHMGEMTVDEADRLPAPAAGHGRADRPGRGRPILRLADPGVVVPHRVSRDPAHPVALARGTWPGRAWRRRTSRRPCCASSTTRWRRREPCRWVSPNA